MTTAERFADNILATFDQATREEFREGMIWYHKANALAWELDFINPRRAAGVIAALSPMLRWEVNVRLARKVYAGEDYIPCLPANAEKAKKIRNGWEPLDFLGKGQKVISFFHNIANPWDDSPEFVTVDKHAIDIANGFISPYENSYQGITPRIYAEYRMGYVIAAEARNINPKQMQAITWLAHKNMKWGK